MNTFFKTFFICLILATGFLGYKYVQTVGYEAELSVSKQNPVFGVHKEVEPIPQKQKQEPLKEVKKEVVKQNLEKPVVKKYSHDCYFYSVNGQLTKITRQLNASPSLENTISILLKGPTIQEIRKGIYTEIPSNVDLISLKKQDNKIIINLSSNFGNGGGTQSVENRVKQLSKTVKLIEPTKEIYLHINGKEVEYLGGDGVYIKQPLE